MPSKRISRDLKTAIEGKEWVLKTTRNDILYTEMVNSLEQQYIPRDVYFTHEPHYRCNRCDDDDCNDLVVIMFVFTMFLIFFTLLFSQMLP
jgi:hypothetical protein